MNSRDRINFIKLTEKLVSPERIAKLFQNAEMLRKLPRFLQKMIMERGSKSEPYISFIVEPYSFFLAYEIVDEAAVEALLPKDYELVSAAMFAGSPEKKCMIIGAFNVHTSVFWGNRVELYIIARNKRTNLISWIIHEYESNTISFDPVRGFMPPSTAHSILTTSFLGEIVLDVVSKVSKNVLQLNARLPREHTKPLNQPLWIDGNFSIDYTGEASDVQTKPFGLIFDPDEMKEAICVPPENVALIRNTFMEGVIAKEPFEVLCFPYAQHFYTTTIPMENAMKSREDLEKRVEEISRVGSESSGDEGSCLGYCYSYACKDGCRLKDKTHNHESNQ